MANDNAGTLWRAYYETTRWSFEAYGTTEAEARQGIEDAWTVHVAQTAADPDYPDWDEVDTYPIRAGLYLRDRDTLVLNDEVRHRHVQVDDERGRVWSHTGQPLTADQAEALGFDAGLRDLAAPTNKER